MVDLDLLKVVGKKSDIPQMVVFHGDLPWQNPKKNQLKQTKVDDHTLFRFLYSDLKTILVL